MKRLLLALCVVGATAYYTNRFDGASGLPTQAPKKDVSESPTRVVSSWGPYLPREHRIQQEQIPQPSAEEIHDVPPIESHEAIQDEISVSPTAQGLGFASPESDFPVWVRVKLAAKTHSDASITSHIQRYYPVGTELQVVGRKNGWMHVLDPKNSEQGWIYGRHYLSWIDDPKLKQAADSSPSGKGAAKHRRAPVTAAKKRT